MSILKNSLRQKFAQIPNELITDTRLSNGAFRVAAYLYSRPDNWTVNNKDVQAQLAIKDVGTVSKYWQELIAAGWVDREERQGENGKFGGFNYTLLMSSTVAEIDRNGKTPLRENPVTVKTRKGETPQHINTEIISNTELGCNTSLQVVCEQTTVISPKLKERLNCKNSKHEAAVIEIVDHFNQVSGRKTEYYSKGQLKYLLHWLNEGYTVDDFKAVIDYKTQLFNGTPNENYIALDTYCRFDKFEENLTKAKSTAQPTTDKSLADCELTPEQAEQYEKTRNYILDNYPNLKEVRFFSHREFLAFLTNDTTDFLPIAWRVKATVEKMQRWKLAQMDKLNTNPFERKACGSLYDYIKTGILKELKKLD